MQKIANELEQENLATLSEKMHRSKKTIIEAFNRMIGLSPHKYFTLRCVCDAIHILESKNNNVTLTELAYSQGFYDQAHFIKVFKEHTGLTPKAFRSQIV